MIAQLDFSAYQRRLDDRVRALATDAIEVVGVTVAVRGADGAIIESGPGTKDHDLWVYRCTTAHAALRPLRFEVMAQNRAEGKASQTIPLP